MWHSILHLDQSILEKVLRPLFIYIFLLIALRLGGQRELGQTNALQFVLLLSVANAVQNGIIGNDVSITGAIIGALTLFLVNGLVEIITSRSPRAHALVLGRPVELVIRNRVQVRTMRRQRLSEDDLTQAALTVGGATVLDIERATLAADGTIHVVLVSQVNLSEQIRILNEKIDQLISEK
jgi:uncharacterized membrane protein YcaP (DUF421 family)